MSLLGILCRAPPHRKLYNSNKTFWIIVWQTLLKPVAYHMGKALFLAAFIVWVYLCIWQLRTAALVRVDHSSGCDVASMQHSPSLRRRCPPAAVAARTVPPSRIRINRCMWHSSRGRPFPVRGRRQATLSTYFLIHLIAAAGLGRCRPLAYHLQNVYRTPTHRFVRTDHATICVGGPSRTADDSLHCHASCLFFFTYALAVKLQRHMYRAAYYLAIFDLLSLTQDTSSGRRERCGRLLPYSHSIFCHFLLQLSCSAFQAEVVADVTRARCLHTCLGLQIQLNGPLLSLLVLPAS